MLQKSDMGYLSPFSRKKIPQNYQKVTKRQICKPIFLAVILNTVSRVHSSCLHGVLFCQGQKFGDKNLRSRPQEIQSQGGVR